MAAAATAGDATANRVGFEIELCVVLSHELTTTLMWYTREKLAQEQQQEQQYDKLLVFRHKLFE